MNREEIFNIILEIFKEVLENDQVYLEEGYTSNDVEGWDSLAHILLIVEIEKKFSLKFLTKEILKWKNIGEMIDYIEKKLAK